MLYLSKSPFGVIIEDTMGTISQAKMSEQLKNIFCERGIKVDIIDFYEAPQAFYYHFKIMALSSISEFNRLVQELELVCGYKCDKGDDGDFTLYHKKDRRQFISCGDTQESIKKAVAADIDGENKVYISFGKGNKDFIVTNFDECAHILIAGTTGSGKSCLLNSLICQILCFSSASLVLIDPKQGAEFGLYEQDIHKRIENVCKDTSSALKWLNICVNEMERRYKEMEKRGLKKWDKRRIIIVIDELADLMMTSKKEVESYIVRIAQKGRAAGIHLIVATQDPRAQVVTGLIKYNLPTKVCLKTANIQHSMNVIDCGKGAELLDKGDSYIKLPSSAELYRCQCANITDREIINLITK